MVEEQKCSRSERDMIKGIVGDLKETRIYQPSKSWV
jgi:hypothetical protein